MHSSIVLSTLVAALAVAAPAGDAARPPRPSPGQLFKIQTVPYNKAQAKQFTQYLTSFHVGAGEAAPVGTKNESLAVDFYIAPGSYLTEDLGRTDLPGAQIGLLKQRPYMSDAPTGYNYVSMDFGSGGTPGWVEIANPDGHGRVVVYEGDLRGGPAASSLALCHVNGTSPYPSVGPQYQLLWTDATADRKKAAKCADVALKVVRKGGK